ncbi:MAG: hypothetical protein M3Y59_13000 [Myxococcota bacterium]|nr:hypothetical protein [Myxococcota bacterium]
MSSQPEQRISRERLNQIALRKLQALAIPVQLDATSQELRGEWRFRSGKVVAPGTQVRIASCRFRVEGHDHLKFLDPPLGALEPLSFYDAETPEAFEVRVARALTVRLGYLQSIAGQLAARKLPTKLDAARLVLRAEVETTDHLFELEGDPNGIRITGLRPRMGQHPATQVNFPLNLEEYPTRSDLEVYLSSVTQRGQLTQKQPAAPAPPAQLELAPAPANVLSVQLLQRLGPDVILHANAGKLELIQELRVGGDLFRFQAVHLGGTTFQGRLVTGVSEKWADRFDLARFPGVEELVRVCLGLKPQPKLEPRSEQPQPSATASPSAGSLAPQQGEVWVMMVLVEREVEGEIRYVCADIDGHPYGATRLLKAEDFRATFSPHGPGWRLRIQIDRTEGPSVIYRQVNPKGERGPEKKMPLATLTTVFVPEASAY